MSLFPTFTARLGAAALAAGIAAAGSAATAGVTCGQPYTIQPGDTLSGIAQQAYGSTQSYQIIYSANSAVIGPNPAVISVGVRLEIPCLDNIQASSADASKIRREETTQALPAPDKRVIRFVTASDWAPFTDENLEQGGLAVEVANVAMSQADGHPEYKIDFINDWGAHLQPLLSDHAYDFSLVWFRPNCDKIEKLGEGSQFRCNNLKWSEPIFEQIIGYYNRASEPELTSYNQLMGKTVCRPAGYSLYMMEENDLVEPNITLAQPVAVKDCFTGLADGTYDAVVIASDTGNGAVTDLGLADKVRLNEGLGQVSTMHAVIAYNNPHADEYIAILNSGLRKIKDNGEWFAIVQRQLSAYRAKNS